MKISSHSIKINNINSPSAVVPSPGGGLFKTVLERFLTAEKAVGAALPNVPSAFKSLIELQRNCSALQLQVECASRVADSVSGSIKKIQQLGGQG